MKRGWLEGTGGRSSPLRKLQTANCTNVQLFGIPGASRDHQQSVISEILLFS